MQLLNGFRSGGQFRREVNKNGNFDLEHFVADTDDDGFLEIEFA